MLDHPRRPDAGRPRRQRDGGHDRAGAIKYNNFIMASSKYFNLHYYCTEMYSRRVFDALILNHKVIPVPME